MHHLDPVGRFAPSSLDLSRAAAERHAHLAAARANPTQPRAGRLQRLAVRAARQWGATAQSAPSRPLARPHLDHAVRDGAGCA